MTEYFSALDYIIGSAGEILYGPGGKYSEDGDWKSFEDKIENPDIESSPNEIHLYFNKEKYLALEEDRR